MKTPESLISRLQRIMPPGVKPKFNTAEELLAWHRTEGEKRSAELEGEPTRPRRADFRTLGDLRLAPQLHVRELPSEQ